MSYLKKIILTVLLVKMYPLKQLIFFNRIIVICFIFIFLLYIVFFAQGPEKIRTGTGYTVNS